MPASVFVSYSHKDEALKKKLLTHLALLQEEGVISTWQDRKIKAGSEFDAEIAAQLQSADIILLLISADFLASPYCRSIEMKRALQRHEEGSARVIPIILRSCDWQTGPFAKLLVAPTDGKPVTSWRNRDEAFTDIAKHIRAAAASPKRNTVQRISNLPPRNVNFTGRKDLLASLHEALTVDRTAAVVQALSGLGGVGKTQLAIEYAHEHADQYSIVWWIRSEQSTTLAADYAALAGPLNLSERSLADQNAIVQAVKKHLDESARWLLIFDNVGKPEDIERFIPSRGMGQVIVTSRYQAWRGMATPIPVDVMKRDDAIALLLKRSGANARDDADKLAEELGDLPLALEQAAAYVEQTGNSLGEYLEFFKTRRKELWKKGVSDETRTVSATWNLAIEKIAASDSAAVDLLKLYAFLAPEEIPRGLLHWVEEYGVPQELREFAADKLRMNEAIATLRQYSLVSTAAESIAVHRLVQFVIRDRLTTEEEANWAKAAFLLLNAALPVRPEDSRLWPTYELLLPHVKRIVQIAAELLIDRDDAKDASSAGIRAGYYLRQRADYSGALEFGRQVERITTDELMLLLLRTHIASVLGDLGDYAAELEQNRILLDRHRNVYGDVNLQVARDLCNVGYALIRLNQNAEAIDVLREAEGIYAKLGRQHVTADYAHIKSNLGVALRRTGQNELALREQEEALAIALDFYGEDNAKLVVNRQNLALTLMELGHVDRAKAEFERSLATAERTFGDAHPATCHIRFVIASYATAWSDIDGSAVLVDKAVAGYKKAFGPQSAEASGQVRLFSAEARKAGREDIAEKYEKLAEELRPDT